MGAGPLTIQNSSQAAPLGRRVSPSGSHTLSTPARGVRNRAWAEELHTWMLAGLNGDGPAYTNLLRALVPVLKRFFARRTNGLTSEIDDLVQETLMAIHERRSSYDRERPFTAWLFSIARYKMIDYFRRNRLTQSVEGLQDILVSEGFEESSNASLDIETILGTLPVKQARAIRDTRLLGMSVAEAASRSGLGQSDIKVSVHRGMRTLNTKFAAAL